jgi:hypothetical protein
MKKCKCGKRMCKLYQHHNQYHKCGQWEFVGFMCNSCNTIKLNEGIKEYENIRQRNKSKL